MLTFDIENLRRRYALRHLRRSIEANAPARPSWAAICASASGSDVTDLNF
jgi:hypothetical protein